ncbi:MAG TPA: uracil-DNA glycosylase, partial [Luteolibacter sp.]|nr:uracil-DNA glycosylase [Luteolibacter sp.]
PVDAVIELLQSELARGRTHVLLDEDARRGLRELHVASKQLRQQGQAAPAAQAPAAAGSMPPLPKIVVSGISKPEQLESLRRQAQDWPPARHLGTLRDTMVFATGNPNAQIMFIGEAPGHEEERQREPFVGPAGGKLNDILKAMGLTREDVYISNIVKFRPALPNQTTNNRKPNAEEMACLLPFVQEEIRVVQPSCIICLGGTAAEGLLDLSGTVGSMRGRWHQWENIPARVTYHPSYLLQSGDNLKVKREVWEDMLAVMEKIGMEITDKQRGFFVKR